MSLLFIVAPFETENFSKGISSRNLEFAKLCRGPAEILSSNFDHRYKRNNDFLECQKFVSKCAKNVQLKYIPALKYSKNVGLMRLLSNLYFSISLFFYLLFSLSKGDRVLVNSIPPEVLMFSSWACLFKKAELYVDIRDIWPDALISDGKLDVKERLFSVYCRAVYKCRISGVIKGVQSVAKQFECWSKVNISKSIKPKIVYLGYDVARWGDLDDSIQVARSEQGKFTGVYIGYLNMQFDLMGVFKEELFSSSSLHIIGDGYRSNEYRSVTKDSSQKVKYHGMVAPDRVQSLVREIGPDFALLPLKPGAQAVMPNKLFDYIALGLPIVVLNSEEAGSFVEKHKIGFYFKEAKEFKDFLNSISFHSELAKCSENIRLKRKLFSMQEMYKNSDFLN